MNKKNIYIIFSRTNNNMGSFIRKVTNSKYNHVSLSLNKSLEEMYSFARYNKENILYGGFVIESNIRYQDSQVLIFKIPITIKEYNNLSLQIETMKTNKNKYIYNYFSAFSYLFSKKITIYNSYTCVEFIINIIKTYIKEINIKQFYSLNELRSILKKYTIFENNFNVYKKIYNNKEDNYTQSHIIFYYYYKIIINFIALLYRLIFI
ncbi:MAG: hypothetical protein RR228_01310 [Bacilli bacterium]